MCLDPNVLPPIESFPCPCDQANPLGLEELVRRMDQMDWTEGISIRQSRSAPQRCGGIHQLGQCFPELIPGTFTGSTLNYGYNISHPEEEPEVRPMGSDAMTSLHFTSLRLDMA